jgi:aminopeptidase-like protein
MHKISDYAFIGEEMLAWAKELFPLCRSLTGPGTVETLEYLSRLHPEIRCEDFATGEKVLDWEVPEEWAIYDAYIEHESGSRFAEFTRNNLHVVGYSTPIDTHMALEDLQHHLYSDPSQPEAIPYVTSYYKKRWGFCLSENDRRNLPEGVYRVVVDSAFKDGKLTLASANLPGRRADTIFFSTYICHPSMANNELSGPVLSAGLMKYVKETYPQPRFTYRFNFVPETIGSIAYLSRHMDELKRRVVSGFNLSCVGDDRAYSHVESRLGNTLADTALSAALFGLENVITYPFLMRGSDERQYCAPGIDLPLCGFCRSKYGEYPEYHTSADDFTVVTAQGLQGAFNVVRSIIDAFEVGLYPNAQVLGEPQLAKRGLYPSISLKGSADAMRTRMDTLAYADGQHSIFDIVHRIKKPLKAVVEEVSLLVERRLLVGSDTRTG